MHPRILHAIGTLLLLLSPATAAAQQRRFLAVNLGTQQTLEDVILRVINFGTVTIVTLAGALFVVGAFMIVLSQGNEEQAGTGKDLMYYSIGGMVVVLASYAILRTVYYAIYQL